MNTDGIREQALKELEEEDFKNEVKKYKEKLRKKKTLMSRIFPFKIERI